MSDREIKIFLRLHGKQFERNLKRAQADMQRFRRNMNQQMKRVALGMAVVAIAAAGIGASFEQSMANVGSVANASQVEMQALERSARDMGATTAFAAREAAEAQYALVSAGLKTKQVIQALPGVMRLAGATQSELGYAAEATTSALSQFALQASDTNRVVNAYAAGIANSRLTLDRLFEGMKQGGPIAATMGMSLEATVATIGAFANAGLDGGTSGTYLKNVLLELSDVAKSGAGTLVDVLKDWDVSTEGIIGAVRRLEEAGVSAQVPLEELGRRAGPGLAILMRQGSGALEELQRSVTGTDQAFAAYQRQMDTTQGRVKILLSALQEMALRIFDVMKGPLNRAIVWATNLIQDNYQKIQDYTARIVSAVQTAIEVISAVFGFLVRHWNTVTFFIEVLGILAGAIYIVATAWKVLNMVQRMNPLMWVVTVIYLLIAAILLVVKHLGGWRAAWIKLQAGMRVGLSFLILETKKYWENIKYIAEVFAKVGETIWVVLKDSWEAIKTFGGLVVEVFSSIGRLIMEPWKRGEILDGLKSSLATALDGMYETTQTKVDGIWSGLGVEHAAEMDRLQAEHQARLERIVKETRAALAATKTTSTAGIMGPETPEMTLPDEIMGPPVPVDLGSLRTSADEAITIVEGMTEAMTSTYQTAWDSMIDMDMTGTERREAIWSSMSTSLWRHLGKMTSQWIFAETTQAAATQAGETVKTTAKTQGVMARIAIGAKEMASDIKQGAINIWNAVTGFFKAHAGIPFVGLGIAAGFIAIMYAALRKAKAQKFAAGGFVDGPSGPDQVPAMLTRGEFVVPVRAAKQFRPILGAMIGKGTGFGGLVGMRDAAYAGAGAGGEGSRLEIHIHGNVYDEEGFRKVVRKEIAPVLRDVRKDRDYE
ncbi:MAG: phage tail tape measure protein [Candidatus Eisenbacteria bacterium]|nr:phage tail tape measure protein [Candidatus Eisenbacteria bacterium]